MLKRVCLWFAGSVAERLRCATSHPSSLHASRDTEVVLCSWLAGAVAELRYVLVFQRAPRPYLNAFHPMRKLVCVCDRQAHWLEFASCSLSNVTPPPP